MRNIGSPVRTSIALGLTLLVAASALSCSHDTAGPGDGPGPGTGPGPAVLATLEVTPAGADLCAPGNTVQLTIVARDQKGAQLPVGTGTVTYSSSAPEIAGVSSSGVVAAAASGTAVITATFTLGGITRTASMKATVHEAPAEYPEIAGVYDLKTLQTFSQWGMEGTLHTAVITIQHSQDTPLFAGTFADFSMFYHPDDESPRNIPFSGSVSGFVDCVGGVVLELRAEGQEDNFWHGKGTLASGQIVGDFTFVTPWQGPSEGGTFTTEPRQAQ